MGIPNAEYRPYEFKAPAQFISKSNRPFNLLLPVQRSWRSSKRRMLLIYETVDSADLESGKLLSSTQGVVLDNVIKLAKQYAECSAVPALAAVNFDYFRNRHLPHHQVQDARKSNKVRIDKLIRALKPTDVFIFGATAASYFFDETPRDLFLHQGKVRKIGDIYWNHTVDLSGAYQNSKKAHDEDESRQDLGNLLGFVSRCFGNSLVRKHVHQIEFTPRGRWITTMAEWKKLYAKLKSVDAFSLDTEAESLGRKVNKVQTVQIAFGPKIGYCVPIHHKDSPFNETQIEVIRRDLRSVFAKRFDYLKYNPNRFILGQNLKFDGTILRQWLNIQTLYWPVLDLMSSEFLLDENMKANALNLGKNGRVSSFGLEWMCEFYGCDFYSKNAFTKKHRALIAEMPLKTEGLLEYIAADVQIPWLIWGQQKKRAAKHKLFGRSYLNTYIKLLLTQMSNIVHMQSQMEHRGDHLDIKWLKSLRTKDGPLAKVEAEFKLAFRKFKSVQKTNSRLLAAKGQNTQSIFGEANWVFDTNKPAHKRDLFFNVLKLEPLYLGKSGEPSVDSYFQEAYKHVPEVAAFRSLAQVDKVRSTYVDGFLRKLKTDPDMAVDHCLRPNFGHVNTVTGRPNSSNPNLQNIIQRGPLAKLIKRAFTAPFGSLTIKLDYSAHEVRVWGIRSGDRRLTGLFVTGRWLRQMFRKTGKPVFKALMETIGDIHKLNANAFMQVAVEEVSKEQRDQVKSIVFGCFTGDTIVSTENGPVRVGELCESKTKPKILTRGDTLLKSGGAKSQGIKPVVGVLTRHAYLKGTESHKILTVTGGLRAQMVPLADLKAGDLVVYQGGYIGTSTPTLNGRALSIADVEAMGLFTADGSGNYYVEQGSYRLHHGSIGTVETCRVAAFFKRHGGIAPSFKKSKTANGDAYSICQINNKALYTSLDEFGLLGNQYVRRVPSAILSASGSYVKAYLRGYFEGDGGVRNVEEHPQVFASTCNVELATDMCYLLNALDIQARMYRMKGRYVTLDGREILSQPSIEIVISHADSVRLFLETIGFITEAKKEAANNALVRISSYRVSRATHLDIAKIVDYAALREVYALRAGVKTFRGPNPVVVSGVVIPPLPNPTLGALIADIDRWRDAFYVLGLDKEWDTLHMLSRPGSTTSMVVEPATYLGEEEVFDVVNVVKDHTWSANGVIVSNSIYGRGARAIARQVKSTAEVIRPLMDKFFKRFAKASASLKQDNENAVKHGHTVSPIGRMRNMYAHMFGLDDLTSGVQRRGANAPIQGFAADIGETAAYIYEIHLREFLERFKLEDGQPNSYTDSGVNSFVHDAIKTVAKYRYMLAAVQILQWCCTIGVCEYYTKMFGVKFTVEPEIEIEIGASDDSLQKWDWHEDSLRKIIRAGLEKQATIYEDLDVDKTEKLIWKMRKTEAQAYLDKHYPVLSNWPDADHVDVNSEDFKTNLMPKIKAWKPAPAEAK